MKRASGTLLGKPIAYRAASAAASAYRPLAAFQFRRTERVRIEWPALQAVESHQARLLDRTGKPIAIPLTTAMRDNGGTQMVATDLNLAPLSNGDYLIEVTAKAGEKSQTAGRRHHGCRWRGKAASLQLQLPANCLHFLFAGGAPPPPARVGPHPHAKTGLRPVAANTVYD